MTPKSERIEAESIPIETEDRASSEQRERSEEEMDTRNEEEEEEEEGECRICRSSDGTVLFMPCRCRGSIRYVHETCLTAWLNHKGTNKCELCSYVFKFEPVYAPDAPSRVSTPVMMYTGFKFILRTALPFLARLALSITLWLVATPLATCILYRAWVHSVPSHIPVAWSWRRVAEEVGSGLAIVAAIVISFLSLLSFTDYMRVRWELLDDVHEDPVVPNAPMAHQPNQAHQQPDLPDIAPARNNVEQNQPAQREEVPGVDEDEEPPPLQPRPRDNDQEEENEEDDDVHTDDALDEDEDTNDDEEEIPELIDDEEEENEEQPLQAAQQEPRLPPPAVPAAPIFPQRHHHIDEEEEIELHIAVDELLGLRGPVVNVARNVSWLIVFNAAYLGVFAFVPFAVGSMVSNGLDPRQLRLLGARIAASIFGSGNAKLPSTKSSSSTASITNNHSSPPTLRLDDLVTMGMGYAAMGLVACAWRAALKSAPSWLRRRAPPRTLRRAERALDAAAAAAKVAALLVLKMVLLPSVLGAGLDRGLTRPGLIAFKSSRWHPFSWPQVQNHSLILVSLDKYNSSSVEEYQWSTTPEHLDKSMQERKGTEEEYLRLVWSDFNEENNDTENNDVYIITDNVDASPHDDDFVEETAQQSREEDRVNEMTNLTKTEEMKISSVRGIAAAAQFLGGGWLGCALARWVLGITFMLVVTVAVLQLREVLHPSILARAVRPHEPRPDLLATLLAEPAKAHARRLATSLAIYGALLILAISIPAAALGGLCSLKQNESNECYLFVARFSYAAPRAQIPIELVLFHLALLGLLERLKTKLREAQHTWLRFSCRSLDLERFLLPMPGNNHTNDRAPLLRWAWGEEQPGPIEMALEPRAPPRDGRLGIRLTLLGLASWLAIVLAALVLGLGPLLLGRFLLELLRFPSSHDPLNLAIGWATLVFVFSPHLDEIEQFGPEDAPDAGIPAAVPQPAVINEVPPVAAGEPNTEHGLSRRWRRGFAALLDDDLLDASRIYLYCWALIFCILWFGVAPLSLGCMYDVVLVASREDWAEWVHGLPPLDYVRDWMLGICVLNGLALIAAREYHHNMEGEDEPEARWMAACARFMNGISKFMQGHSLASCFDPEFVYRLALPIIIDVAETAMEAAVPTWAGLLAGRALIGAASTDAFAPSGAQLLVLFRYALVGIFVATASLHLVDPIKNCPYCCQGLAIPCWLTPSESTRGPSGLFIIILGSCFAFMIGYNALLYLQSDSPCS